MINEQGQNQGVQQPAPERTHHYERRSVISGTLQDMIAFHEAPAALSALTPPPIFIRVRGDTRTSMREGQLEFTLWFGPIPLRWMVQHEPGPTDTSFADRMLSGPVAYWRHEHIFREIDGGIELTDRLQYAHKRGIQGMFTRLMFNQVSLWLLFFYRHRRTRIALKGMTTVG